MYNDTNQCKSRPMYNYTILLLPKDSLFHNLNDIDDAFDTKPPFDFMKQHL